MADEPKEQTQTQTQVQTEAERIVHDSVEEILTWCGADKKVGGVEMPAVEVLRLIRAEVSRQIHLKLEIQQAASTAAGKQNGSGNGQRR